MQISQGCVIYPETTADSTSYLELIIHEILVTVEVLHKVLCNWSFSELCVSSGFMPGVAEEK